MAILGGFFAMQPDEQYGAIGVMAWPLSSPERWMSLSFNDELAIQVAYNEWLKGILVTNMVIAPTPKHLVQLLLYQLVFPDGSGVYLKPNRRIALHWSQMNFPITGQNWEVRQWKDKGPILRDKTVIPDSLLPATPWVMTTSQLDEYINRMTATNGTIDFWNLSEEMLVITQTYMFASKAMEEGKHALALAQFNQLLAEQPNFVAARVNYALSLSQAGKEEQALKEIQIAHEKAPKDYQVHIAWSTIYRILGNTAQSIAQLKDAIHDDPNAIDPLMRLGVLYALARDLQTAEQYLFEGLQKMKMSEMANYSYPHPARAHLLFNLGLLYHQAGVMDRALVCWREYLDLNPNNPDARKNYQAALNALDLVK